MQLPNENATTAELRRFAAGLSTEHRMRLAAALIYPEISEIYESGDSMTDDAEKAGQVFAGEFEKFEAFADFICQEI